MFCTSKEQENCEVEKRGCEGCYYESDKNRFKNIKEILDLCEEEITLNNTETYATLDLEDLKELEELYIAYYKTNAIMNNLAKAVKFMSTNADLTIQDIIDTFSPDKIAIDFDDFIDRREKEQKSRFEG